MNTVVDSPDTAVFMGSGLRRNDGGRSTTCPICTPLLASARLLPEESRMRLRLSLLAAAAFLAAPTLAEVEKPAAIVADGIPAIPDELAERTRPSAAFRAAARPARN